MLPGASVDSSSLLSLFDTLSLSFSTSLLYLYFLITFQPFYVLLYSSLRPIPPFLLSIHISPSLPLPFFVIPNPLFNHHPSHPPTFHLTIFFSHNPYSPSLPLHLPHLFSSPLSPLFPSRFILFITISTCHNINTRTQSNTEECSKARNEHPGRRCTCILHR